MRHPANSSAKENRNKIDAALTDLAQLIGPLLGTVIEHVLQEGHWSLDDLHPEIRSNVRTPDDISRSGDLSLILSVMRDCWNPLKFDNDLTPYGITFQLVDKVWRLRNDLAHNQSNYNDTRLVDNYLRDIGDLRQGFLDLFAKHSGTAQTMVQPDQIVRNFVMQANEYLEAGRWNDAVVDCTRALSIDRNCSDAYLIRGRAYRQLRNYDGAVEDLGMAVKFKPNDPDAHGEKGWAYIDAGRFQQAIHAFDDGVKRLPDVASLWHDRGLAFEYNGQTQQAFDDYVRATKVDPNFASAWAQLGRLYTDMGHIDSAISHLDWAIGLNPRLAWIWNNRGYAYIQKKKYGEAIGDLQQSLQLDPHDDLTRANLKIARSMRRKLIIRWSFLAGIGSLLILWIVMSI